MSKLLNIVTPLHQKTKRTYLDRMVDNKVEAMLKAKEYGFDYWDGDRRYGYGGYKYDGRQEVIAEALIKEYNLQPAAKILDIGCGKGFLLYEFQKLLPEAELWGMDISKYAFSQTPPDLKASLLLHSAEKILPWETEYFDLVISIGCLHNLKIPDLGTVLEEIERVGKNGYIMVESYRNEQEQFNLECWALTAETLLDNKSWEYVFNLFCYTGDYEFIYFE